MPNEYNNDVFFAQYAQMDRSKGGLAADGEWHQLQPLFPPLEGMAVLDLGCGYGWHCKYAADHGAAQVLGIALSEKMLAQADGSFGKQAYEILTCLYKEVEFSFLHYF